MTAEGQVCPTCRTPLPLAAHFSLNCGTPTPTEPGVPARTMPTGVIEVSRIRRALASHYLIEHVLGEGGMATVYLAEDLKHHRKVAIKVMRPELAATLGADRFLREIEIAARLSHPNILAVHDSGNVDGILYYVMPLVEGESLPARLAREKQLPVEEALRIAREVAEALAYAHSRGIVHRDIKPANILMNAGHAMVADFGIARAAGGDAHGVTQTGIAIGTPQYMSPEQASGDPNVDGRTDIYALGCVLYEMLAGEPPFNGPTAHAIISRSITDAPRPLQQTRPSIVPAVSTVVMTALAKTPADRFPTGAAMAAALSDAQDHVRFGSGPTSAASARPASRRVSRRMLAGVAVAVLAVCAGGYALTRTHGVVSDGKSVAVLPFENQGSADDAYFASGMVDELRDKLARVNELTVTAAASSDQYKATAKTTQQIASELHVDQVLTGKVRWGANADGKRHVRVTTELLNGRTGNVTWRDNFDADMTDAFDIEGRIATRVAAALGAALDTRQTKQLASRLTSNAAAYDLYLKGQAIHSNSAGPLREKIGYYEQAVALDSNFTYAWGSLSVNSSLLYANGNREPVVGRRAKEALDRVLRLAPDSAGAHLVAATYYMNVTADTARQIGETARALALDSNSTWALQNSAAVDMARGNNQAGLQKLARARKLDPRSISVLSNIVVAQLSLGGYADAATATEEMLALKPTAAGAFEEAAYSHLALGDTAGARGVVVEALSRIPATELVSYFAGYQEMAFVLPDSLRTLLFRLTPASFDNDRAWWGQSLATAAYQQGDMARARAYADSALEPSRAVSAATPKDPELRLLYALMLAYTGHNDDANREAEHGLVDAKDQRGQNLGYHQLLAARVYIATGQTDKAMSALEKARPLLYYLTPGLLRIEPTFKPLRGNPRFERLVSGVVNGTRG